MIVRVQINPELAHLHSVPVEVGLIMQIRGRDAVTFRPFSASVFLIFLFINWFLKK